MRTALRCGVALCALLAMGAVQVRADLTLPPLNYAGAFRMGASFGSYGLASLAYYKDPDTGQESLYHNNYSNFYICDIPEPLDPGVVGWAGLNTQSLLSGPVTIGGKSKAGIRIRNDGAADTLYTAGNSGDWDSASMDLGTTAYLGTGGTSHHRGLSPAPADFVTHCAAPAEQDTLDAFAWCNAPWLHLAAPQLGDGSASSVPSTEILRITDAYQHANSHYTYTAVEWLQSAGGSSAFQDGFIVVAEKDSGPAALNWSLVFYDPSQLPYVSTWGANPDYWLPADGTRMDIDPYLSPGVNYHSSHGGIWGLAYDPETGRLFVGENGNDPGAVVHVFESVVPEPATLGLLILGLLPLLRPRRRRK